MNICCYFHSGSKNHGCEAIVRSTAQILNQRSKLYSFHIKEDQYYKINQIMDIVRVNPIDRWSFCHIFFYVIQKISKTNSLMYQYKYFRFFHDAKAKDMISLSIGGDNYCYPGVPAELMFINKKLNKQNVKTVLWGCSIEPELLKNSTIIEDMKRYALITARESITYQALSEAGLHNVKLYPDPAFTLQTIQLELPENFVQDNTIGINVSPMAIDNESVKGATINNYETLLRHIISTTNMQIALIPHVVWNSNDDRVPLRKLYEKFQDTGRVVMIEDHNCMELKGYISRCRMFIGARTHATIAAYSTCVPTLAIGYSVKAKGIAKDIFGTYEDYVIPVQSLQNSDDLIRAFEWLKGKEKTIRQHLKEFMPSYCAEAWQAGDEIKQLMEESVPCR